MRGGRKTLQTWIAEAKVDPDKEKPVSMMTLVHMVGQAEREIHTVRFGGNPREDSELAQLFQGKAETYCQDIPGVQSFCLLAFYGTNEPEARHTFIINVEQEFNGLATEGPHAQGLTQQAMRHSEAIIQMSFRQTAMLFDSTQRTLAMLSDQNVKLMQERNDAYEIVHKVMLKDITDSREHDEKMAREAQAAEERKKWLSFAPALLNTILGREVFPQATADTALIETIVSNLDEKSIMKMAEVVPASLWGPLAARFETSLRNRRLLREENSKAFGDEDPEANAVGGAE